MPSKLKKLVLSRMEKYGENYQTALRNVRAEAHDRPADIENISIDELVAAILEFRDEKPAGRAFVARLAADRGNPPNEGTPRERRVVFRNVGDVWRIEDAVEILEGELSTGVRSLHVNTKAGQEELARAILEHLAQRMPALRSMCQRFAVTGGRVVCGNAVVKFEMLLAVDVALAQKAVSRHPKRVGGMRPLGTLKVPQFLETYHSPVADLGVREVRFTETTDRELDGLYFILEPNVAEETVVELARRARHLFAFPGVELVIIGKNDGGSGAFLWSSDSEDQLTYSPLFWAILGEAISSTVPMAHDVHTLHAANIITHFTTSGRWDQGKPHRPLPSDWELVLKMSENVAVEFPWSIAQAPAPDAAFVFSKRSIESRFEAFQAQCRRELRRQDDDGTLVAEFRAADFHREWWITVREPNYTRSFGKKVSSSRVTSSMVPELIASVLLGLSELPEEV